MTTVNSFNVAEATTVQQRRRSRINPAGSSTLLSK